MGDYILAEQSVSFSNATDPGPCVYSILLTIVSDSVIEPVESFAVHLAATSDFVRFVNNVTNVVISDDDSKWCDQILFRDNNYAPFSCCRLV